MLELYSIDVIEFDTLIGNECDLTDDVAFSDLLARAQAGEFFAALIGTPVQHILGCSDREARV